MKPEQGNIEISLSIPRKFVVQLVKNHENQRPKTRIGKRSVTGTENRVKRKNQFPLPPPEKQTRQTVNKDHREARLTSKFQLKMDRQLRKDETQWPVMPPIKNRNNKPATHTEGFDRKCPEKVKKMGTLGIMDNYFLFPKN